MKLTPADWAVAKGVSETGYCRPITLPLQRQSLSEPFEQARASDHFCPSRPQSGRGSDAGNERSRPPLLDDDYSFQKDEEIETDELVLKTTSLGRAGLERSATRSRVMQKGPRPKERTRAS
jgi:hypothetical protein